MQGAHLAMALLRLPRAYTAALGRRLDGVHLLLLGLLLSLGAGAGLSLARSSELRQRQAWLRRRLPNAGADACAGAADAPGACCSQ